MQIANVKFAFRGLAEDYEHSYFHSLLLLSKSLYRNNAGSVRYQNVFALSLEL